MPELSSLQTSFMPLQQFWLALMLPPPGSTGAPQMLPTGLQDWPLSQRLPSHCTLPLGFVPPPQHCCAFEQNCPVSVQPPAARHTVWPEPGFAQIREQQLLPPAHGSPACTQPPGSTMQRPAPPSFTVHRPLQQSLPRWQTSPPAWHEKARVQTPPPHSREQQSLPVVHAWPTTRQLPPPSWAHWPFAPQLCVQHEVPASQLWPTSRHASAEQLPFTHELLQQSELEAQVAPVARQNDEAPQRPLTQRPPQHAVPAVHSVPVGVHEPPSGST